MVSEIVRCSQFVGFSDFLFLRFLEYYIFRMFCFVVISRIPGLSISSDFLDFEIARFSELLIRAASIDFELSQFLGFLIS